LFGESYRRNSAGLSLGITQHAWAVAFAPRFVSLFDAESNSDPWRGGQMKEGITYGEAGV
jgi:hypothetical protein